MEPIDETVPNIISWTTPTENEDLLGDSVQHTA
jgi:hypothetical protein